MPATEEDGGLAHDLLMKLYLEKLRDKSITAAEQANLLKMLDKSSIQCVPSNKTVKSIVKELKAQDDEDSDDAPIPFPLSK